MSSVSQNHLSAEQTISGAAGEMSMSDKHPMDDLYCYFVDYARERPEVCALWALGIGFVLGWRLKPW